MTKQIYSILLLSISLIVNTLTPAQTTIDEKVSLDSLRVQIQTIDGRIKVFKDSKNKLTIQFDQINRQIYELKAIDNPGLFTNISLKSKLKSAKEIADQIVIVNQILNTLISQQNELYQQAINVIDRIVVNYLNLAKEGVTRDRDEILVLDITADLKAEKEQYAAKLYIFQNKSLDIKSIELLPEDNIPRIRLKLFILEDELEYLNQLTGQKEARISSLNGIKKSYEEMLYFYSEVETNIDDRYDFIDINQLIEIRDRIDEINRDIINTEREKRLITANIDSLTVKLDLFHETLIKTDPTYRK